MAKKKKDKGTSKMSGKTLIARLKKEIALIESQILEFTHLKKKNPIIKREENQKREIRKFLEQKKAEPKTKKQKVKKRIVEKKAAKIKKREKQRKRQREKRKGKEKREKQIIKEPEIKEQRKIAKKETPMQSKKRFFFRPKISKKPTPQKKEKEEKKHLKEEKSKVKEQVSQKKRSCLTCEQWKKARLVNIIVFLLLGWVTLITFRQTKIIITYFLITLAFLTLIQLIIIAQKVRLTTLRRIERERLMIPTEKIEKFKGSMRIYAILFLISLPITIIGFFFLNLVVGTVGLGIMFFALLGYNLIKRYIGIAKKQRVIKEGLSSYEVGVADKEIKKLRAQELQLMQTEKASSERVIKLQELIRREKKKRVQEVKEKLKEEAVERREERIRQKHIDTEQKRLKSLEDKKEKTKKMELELLKTKEQQIKIHLLKKLRNEIKHGRYETDVDKLVELVNRYERIKMGEIAQVFEVKMPIVEEWARILEEHDLIKVHYPPIGDAELVKRKPKE